MAEGLDRAGLTYDDRHTAKHLPGTPEAAKRIQKDGAAHVFHDEATLHRVEEDIFTRGEQTGSVRGADRYGVRYEESIGSRVDAEGNKVPLHYGEMKVDPATGKYHVIPPDRTFQMNKHWYEVWADGSLATPYVLLVMPDPKGSVVVRDPKEGMKVVYEGMSYQNAKDWLLEDEYTRVEGRVQDDD